MRILLIKTSSLGDVVHTLPAIEDLTRRKPSIHIDWLVEDSFKAIPNWHPHVNRVIPVAIRQWRKQPFSKQTRHAWQQLKHTLQQQSYELIIDLQGLLKSAILANRARHWNAHPDTRIIGYDKHSIREPLASYFYQQKASISYQQHAILRNRLLMATALDYDINELALDYGIASQTFTSVYPTPKTPYIICFHGTSKLEKEWSETNWHQLIQAFEHQNMQLLFPWGNANEQQRADRLTAAYPHAHVLPKSNLDTLAHLSQHASAVIGMDTGLMHIAAALNKIGIGLYPITQPKLTGVMTAGHTQLIENIAGVSCNDPAFIIKKLKQILMTSHQTITLTGYILVPAADLDKVLSALPKHIELSQQEAGCLQFHVEQDENNIHQFHVNETFINQQAFDAHQQRIKQSEWGAITKHVERHYQIQS